MASRTIAVIPVRAGAPRPSAAIQQRMDTRSFFTWAIAALCFYFPLAYAPPMKAIRIGLLHLPVLGNPYERNFELGIFLLPDFVVAVLLVALYSSLRGRAAPLPGARARTLIIACGMLTIVGGVVASIGSDYPGLSLAGLVARVEMFLLAWLILAGRPTPRAVQLWLFAAITGVSVVMAVGTYVYVHTIGWPTSLTSLYQVRSSVMFQDYARVTYGHPNDTSALLVLITPATLMLLLARSTRPLERMFLGVALGLMSLNAVFAFARWGVICLAVAVFLVMWYFRRSGRGALMVAALTITGIVVSGALIRELGPYFARALTGGASDFSNLATRQSAWSEGFQAFLLRPAGTGFGTVNVIDLQYTAAHNQWIDIAIEGGVLVLLAFLAWTLVHLVALARVMFDPSVDHDLAVALLLGPGIFALFGIFNSAPLNLSGNAVWLAFWILFPTMAYALLEDGKRAEPRVVGGRRVAGHHA